MTLTLLIALAVLALLDSTSFGTLVIPIWLLLAPGRLRPGRVLVFLGTVAVLYGLIGVLVLGGANLVLPDLAELRLTDGGTLVQLLLGVGMLVAAFLVPGKTAWERKQERLRAEGGQARPGRLARWRERAVTAEGGGTRVASLSLVGLAVTAVGLEVITMLPYVGALGMIAATGMSRAAQLGVLAVYCLVMIGPALVLLALRTVAGGRLDPWLRRVATWLEREGGETFGWVLGIVGFLIARDAFARAGGFEALIGSVIGMG